MKLNYSTLAHTLHSRLQLIRNKLDYKFGMEPAQMVIRNLRYFEKAGESVQRYHNFHSTRSDFIDAAELFMSTVEPNETGSQSPKWMVEMLDTGDNRWYPISEETLLKGQSGKIEPLTLEKAGALYTIMCQHGDPNYVRVSRYKKP